MYRIRRLMLDNLEDDRIQIVIGLTLFSLFVILSFFFTSEPKIFYGMAILFLAVYLWLFTPISYIFTTFLIISMSVLLDIVPSENAFLGFASSTIFFLIGAFIIALTVEKHGLHKRIALKILNYFGETPKRFIHGIVLIGTFLAMLMPEHGVTALFLPILMSIFALSEKSSIMETNFVKASLLALCYGASVGSMGTLLGGARNPLAIAIYYQQTGQQISFTQWFIAAIPLVLIMSTMVYLVLTKLFDLEDIDMKNIKRKISQDITEMGPMSMGEAKSLGFLVSAFILWAVLGQGLGMGLVAVLITSFIAMSKTITWEDVEKRLPWGVIFLYGGAISLSLILPEAGTLAFISEEILTFVGNNPFLVLAVFAALAVFLSNVMSNAATTAVILPMALVAMVAIGFSAVIPVYTIAMVSAFAFMLPVGTPGAAMVYNTGYIDIKEFVKAGLILNIIGLATFLTIGLAWWRLLGLW
ncbi:MAG: DASS family sodium-coupled anion symporter [Thermoplasmata archaeon]